MRFLIRKAVSPGSERNPHEEFLLKNTQVNLQTFSHFIRVVSLPFHTTQHNTTQHNTTQHNTTQHNTTQHNTTQHNTTQHNTTQLNIMHSKTTQCTYVTFSITKVLVFIHTLCFSHTNYLYNKKFDWLFIVGPI